MAEFSYTKITTLVTPGGTITFNATGADTLYLDPGNCRGLGDFDVRAPVDPRGQTSGFLLHPFFLPGAELLLVGIFEIISSGTEAGYVAARDSLMDGTYSKLKSAAATSTSTLNFTGGATISGLKVRRSAFHGGFRKGFTIDLVGTTLP
jgi:hypothetical protein